MTTLTELLNPKTEDQYRLALVQLLAGAGFPVNDWHDGGVEKTKIYAVARALADLDAGRIPQLAASGFLDTSGGGWLSKLVYSQYDETRKAAVFAIIPATLTAAPGRGPYTIQPGDIWAQTASGLRFFSLTGGTIPEGGALGVYMQAESPGAAYNIPNGTLTNLLTPFPGVTINNTAGLFQAGVNEESDAALRERARLKWASIGYGATSDAYKFHALSSLPAVTKVRVLDQHPRGENTLDVIVWGEGGLSPSDVAAVNAYIQERRANTADVEVYAATARVIPIEGTVYVSAAMLAAAQSQAAANIATLQQGNPIGATAYLSAIVEALNTPAGVRNTDLTAPADDVVLLEDEAAVFDLTGLDWVVV